MFLLFMNILQTMVLLGTLLMLYLNWSDTEGLECSGNNIFSNTSAIALMINVFGIGILLLQSFLSLSFIYVKFYITNSVEKFQYKQIREVMLLD